MSFPNTQFTKQRREKIQCEPRVALVGSLLVSLGNGGEVLGGCPRFELGHHSPTHRAGNGGSLLRRKRRSLPVRPEDAPTKEEEIRLEEEDKEGEAEARHLCTRRVDN